MRNIFGLFVCSMIMAMAVQAQDSIRSRVILIGDAGKIDAQQKAVLAGAAANIIPGKTTVLFLGDNVYPSGLSLPGGPDSAITREILKAQFAPMRARGASVYFLPGNHDWDAMGKQGLAKIQEQWRFLEAQHDPALKLVPANGCPDPVEIDVSDSLVIIAFDSEWWLFTHNKADALAGCACDSNSEVTEKMADILYRNRYKVILLAAHHPFQSYGHHGGYYSLKDHLFPLTSINPNLYIPLPVIGSLYPLLRSVFLNPEDMGHPLYKRMIYQVDGVFEGFPNLIHVAGHEHGLQLIQNGQLQVVSGAGAKNAFVKKGKHALFGARTGGYVTADLMAGNNVRLTYYTVQGAALAKAFSYDRPYTDIKRTEDSARVAAAAVDSVDVQANAAFDHVSTVHKAIFGRNYRKEWAAKTRLPLIKLSQVKGGLTPLQRGGGHQSKSLRLKDKSGKEWVLRSVNKFPEVLLPEQLRQTFAKDIVTDAMSAQHPYSSLVVATIADAAGVPHAHPMIGLVAPDTALGIYGRDFVNTVCLLEEREPSGKSVNAAKMYKAFDKDHDNRYDSVGFLKARLLDLFLGDWDRHEDQWRWATDEKGKGTRYTAVPRDRDQVFHVMQGFLPKLVSRPWIAPMLHNFNGRITRIEGFYIESNALNKRFLSGFDYEQWMAITNAFVAVMSDSLLETALRQLPQATYALSHDVLIQKWKERRGNMPAAMEEYYRFLNRTVDLQTSDKGEFVSFTDAPSGGLLASVYKLNKEGKIGQRLYERVFDAGVTREIRLYVNKGDDSVVVNTAAPVRLRIIGKKGEKTYNIVNAARKVRVYGKEKGVQVIGRTGLVTARLSADSLNTVYVPANPYNVVAPMITAGYNLDDGLLLGGSVKFTNQGFRKKPYASMQMISLQHSFSTSAFKFKVHSEWLQVFGKADLLADAKVLAPDNTQNFFGVGNDTRFDKTGDYKRFYRARFSVYQLDAAARWHLGKTASVAVGPSLQIYGYDKEDNGGRFITHPALIHSSDSLAVDRGKIFAGAVAQVTIDRRDNKLLPTNGARFNMKLQYYTGLNDYSRSFLQVAPEFSVYKSLDRQAAIVLADRVGGGVSAGHPAFYQSVFLGGQDNLLGYRQYRFAGQSMLYNNFEIRIRLAQVASYVIPGQLGLVAFYDAGKVWAEGYNSQTIHQGVGGGLYFAPAQLTVLQLVAGYSQEGWYPYLTLGVRF